LWPFCSLHYYKAATFPAAKKLCKSVSSSDLPTTDFTGSVTNSNNSSSTFAKYHLDSRKIIQKNNYAPTPTKLKPTHSNLKSKSSFPSSPISSMPQSALQSPTVASNDSGGGRSRSSSIDEIFCNDDVFVSPEDEELRLLQELGWNPDVVSKVEPITEDERLEWEMKYMSEFRRKRAHSVGTYSSSSKQLW
jgi:hypothetical protein